MMKVYTQLEANHFETRRMSNIFQKKNVRTGKPKTSKLVLYKYCDVCNQTL